MLAAIQLLGACGRAEVRDHFELGDRIQVMERRIFWLDADTLVFPARVNSGDPGYDMYIWSPGVSDARVYQAGVWANRDAVFESYFCASNGVIGFSAQPPRLTSVPGQYEYDAMVGPPGGQEPRTIRSFRPTISIPGGRDEARGLTPANSVWDPHGLLSGVDCTERSDEAMVGMGWAFTYADRPYIAFDQGRDLAYRNARLWGDGQAIPLGIPDGASSPVCVRPTPWNAGAWAWNCSESAESAFASVRITWDINLVTGQAVRTEIPDGKDLLAIPTKAGVFVVSDSVSGSQPGGLFKFVNGRQQLWLKGQFGAAFVSPDGCKIALSKYSYSQESSATLTVVNVCQGGNDVRT